MQDAKIKQLFRLFACLEDAKPFYDLAEAAMMQVKDELREDADQNDIRLSYYAAALANLCYRQMIAAEASAQTYAGGVSGGKNGAAQCENGSCLPTGRPLHRCSAMMLLFFRGLSERRDAA